MRRVKLSTEGRQMGWPKLAKRSVFISIAVVLTRILIHWTIQGGKIEPSFPQFIKYHEDEKVRNESEHLRGNGAIKGKNLVLDILEAEKKKMVDTKTDDISCYSSQINWRNETLPKYQMNPDLLLIPTLYNGPNNQLIGFRQSVLVALLLNRTLVLPQFYEHALTDVTYRGLVDSKYRVDIQHLRKYLSVIPLQEAIKRCDATFNAIFATGRWHVKTNPAKLVRINVEYGLRGAEYVEAVDQYALDALKGYLYEGRKINDAHLLSRPWWPSSQQDTTWMEKLIDAENPVRLPIYPLNRNEPIRLENLKQIYGSKEKCALYWFPFRQFHFKPSNPGFFDSFNDLEPDLNQISMKTGGKLYTDIVQNIKSPPWVLEFADEFRTQYLLRDSSHYLAVHWRYDEKDFFEYLCHSKKAQREAFCGDVKLASNATAISAAILRQLEALSEKTKEFVSSVYFAAPPSLAGFVENVKEILHDPAMVNKLTKDSKNFQGKHPPMLYTPTDLKNFLLKDHRYCTAISTPGLLSDTISQIEMDLCERSTSFLWSKQSTWSKNVLLKRSIARRRSWNALDVSITDFTLEIMKAETR